MRIDNKKTIVIGGIGLIGYHTIDKLVKENVKEISIQVCHGISAKGLSIYSELLQYDFKNCYNR